MPSSNLPPGVSGGAHATEIAFECSEGHRWLLPGFTEMGATYPSADLEGLADFCPNCGKIDVGSADMSRYDNSPLDPDELLRWSAQFVEQAGDFIHKHLLAVWEAADELDRLMTEADRRYREWMMDNPELEV